jgi:DNA-binding transcriptional MocR family regulator
MSCRWLTRELSVAIVSPQVPTAGMFVWLKVEGLRDAASLIDQMMEEVKFRARV